MVQSPEFEMKAMPEDGESLTTTLLAAAGPLFVTAMRNEMLPPAGIVAGPVFTTDRSA